MSFLCQSHGVFHSSPSRNPKSFTTPVMAYQPVGFLNSLPPDKTKTSSLKYPRFSPSFHSPWLRFLHSLSSLPVNRRFRGHPPASHQTDERSSSSSLIFVPLSVLSFMDLTSHPRGRFRRRWVATCRHEPMGRRPS